MKKTKEELIESDEICEYCPLQAELDELPPPVTKYSLGCEGRFCDEAYENYLDVVEDE